ncbi:MAG TPA: glutaredoxin family protein, partial [bacterium]
VMYSTSWCKYCKAARTWLQQTKVPFQDYDVEKDAGRMREFKNLGGTGYPFIVVGDNKMQGWDENTMKQFLGMAD